MRFDIPFGPWGSASETSVDDARPDDADVVDHVHVEDEDGVDRRRLLQAGGMGLAAGLAGCSGVQQQTFESAPISLAAPAMDHGYVLDGASTSEVTRKISAGGQTVEATIISHVASYGRTTESGGRSPFIAEPSVGLATTPKAEVLGKAANPAADKPLEDLLTSDAGKRFLRSLGVDASGWTKGPREVGSRQVTLLDSETDAKQFLGVTTEDDLVLINAARREVDGDVVLAGDARTRTYEGSGDLAGAVDSSVQEEAAAMFAEQVSPNVVLQPPGTATGTGTATTTEPSKYPPGRVPMDEVPKDVKRRVTRLLETASGTPVSWEEMPSLGEFAHIVGRPDVEGTAYYELAIEPKGYVVAATGEHDAPLPHFSSDSRPMGVQLEEQSEGELARLLWIDRLRYVAEDPDGNAMAARGNEVPRIRGLEALAELDAEGPRTAVHGPSGGPKKGKDDTVEEGYQTELREAENDLELPEEFSFEQWESHEALKENYESAYGLLLEDLSERASEAWSQMEESASLVGVDATRREPLLDGETVDSVGGAVGAVDVTRVSRDGTHDVLELSPTGGATPGDEVHIEVGGDDHSETLTFRVAEGDAPGDGSMDQVGDAASLAQTDWAGGFRIQPKYWQFNYQGCAVGCGPVAWALLFGWGDKQAHGGKFNGTWWPRYGLYLDGGGRWANGDEKAPDRNNQDGGGPKEMMKELNRHVDVFCMGDSGATHPKDMDEANRYLWGRTYTNLEVHHSWTGRPIKRARTETRESIRGNANNKGPTPVVVGKGWLSHYPMAYAYWESFWHPDHVKVNNGWGPNPSGGQATEWIWAQSWFSGEIYP